MIDLKDAPQVLERVFSNPDHLSQAADISTPKQTQARSVVFVGHGLGNDDSYLSTLGFDTRNARNIVHKIDTQTIAGGSKKKSIGLKKLLQRLDLEHKNLHNAGNDAAYTLQALLLMVHALH